MGPEPSIPEVALAVQAEPTPAVRGAGSIGSGLPMPTADRQDFELDISWELTGRLFYRDWSMVRESGVATITVDASDASTLFAAYRDRSARCPDPARGVEIDGVGRLDRGDLVELTVVMCDNGTGSTGDAFRMVVVLSEYEKGGALSSGNIDKISGTPPAPAATRSTGVGAVGPGTPTLESDYQEFDFDASATLGGRFRYADYGVVRNGIAGNIFVDRARDAATGFTSFHQVSSTCVRFGGRGRVDTNELLSFYVDACDNGSAGSGDTFLMFIPDRRGRGVPYVESGVLRTGDIAVGNGGTSVGNLTVTTTTTGSSLDPDGYWVTVDGGNGRATPINGSITYTGLAAGSHTLVLSDVAANCSVSGAGSRVVNVPLGGSATESFAVTCEQRATALGFEVQPTDTRSRATITPAVRVRAVDDQGNLVTSFSGVVTIAIGRNGGLLISGTLSGTRSVNAMNGIATFSDLSIDQIGTGYTLRVTGAGLAGAESGEFSISP
jgi:hypothetical protein